MNLGTGLEREATADCGDIPGDLTTDRDGTTNCYGVSGDLAPHEQRTTENHRFVGHLVLMNGQAIPNSNL